jgi:hypothetical protein
MWWQKAAAMYRCKLLQHKAHAGYTHGYMHATMLEKKDRKRNMQPQRSASGAAGPEHRSHA